MIEYVPLGQIKHRSWSGKLSSLLIVYPGGHSISLKRWNLVPNISTDHLLSFIIGLNAFPSGQVAPKNKILIIFWLMFIGYHLSPTFISKLLIGIQVSSTVKSTHYFESKTSKQETEVLHFYTANKTSCQTELLHTRVSYNVLPRGHFWHVSSFGKIMYSPAEHALHSCSSDEKSPFPVELISSCPVYYKRIRKNMRD